MIEPIDYASLEEFNMTSPAPQECVCEFFKSNIPLNQSENRLVYDSFLWSPEEDEHSNTVNLSTPETISNDLQKLAEIQELNKLLGADYLASEAKKTHHHLITLGFVEGVFQAICDDDDVNLVYSGSNFSFERTMRIGRIKTTALHEQIDDVKHYVYEVSCSPKISFDKLSNSALLEGSLCWTNQQLNAIKALYSDQCNYMTGWCQSANHLFEG
jgi:hypothetical protein